MRVRVSLVDPSPPTPDHLPRAAVAAPGEPVWVGRTPAATLCVPADAALDDRHALVVCYDGACRVFDASGRGLLVDGAVASEALLRDGSVVRAGATVARVEVLADDAAPEGPASDDAAPADDRDGGGPDDAGPPHVAPALAVLRRAPAPLYAVLDAARRAPGVGWARSAQELMAAIPDDVDALDYADAAPYLVRLAPESPLLARLLEVSWGHAECAFLTSTRPFAEVRTFLRDLVDARVDDGTAEGRRVMFRFYDPVVLGRLLAQPGFDAGRFFGPGLDPVVRAWYVEAPAVAAEEAAEAPELSAELGATSVAGDPWDDEPADDAAWVEAPEPPPAAPSRPSVLLEFRPQVVIPAGAAPAGAARTSGASAVRVVRREHYLPEVDAATRHL